MQMVWTCSGEVIYTKNLNDRITGNNNTIYGDCYVVIGNMNVIVGKVHSIQGHHNDIKGGCVSIDGNYNTGVLFTDPAFSDGEGNAWVIDP